MDAGGVPCELCRLLCGVGLYGGARRLLRTIGGMRCFIPSDVCSRCPLLLSCCPRLSRLRCGSFFCCPVSRVLSSRLCYSVAGKGGVVVKGSSSPAKGRLSVFRELGVLNIGSGGVFIPLDCNGVGCTGCVSGIKRRCFKQGFGTVHSFVPLRRCGGFLLSTSIFVCKG